MLDDRDIEKLKSVFATKGDFGNFATKNDLKDLATRDDLARFATKADFYELKEEIDVIKENTQSILVSVDGIGKSFDKLDSEYVALKSQVSRHEEKLSGVAA